MLGAGRPIPQKKKAAAPKPSFQAQPAPAPKPTFRTEIKRVVTPARVYYPPKTVAPARVYYPPKTAISYPKPGGYGPVTAPMPPNAVTAPPLWIGPPVPAPPDSGTVLPFRRPRKMIRQRRGGGNQDWADELNTQSAENDTIPYTEQPPVIIAPADPTLPGGPADPNRIGPVTTGPLPDVTDSENAADGNSSDAANAVESGEPYSVIEESEANSNAALPESAPPQSDSGEMGDIFADARAWMSSLDPVNRATISASDLLAKFNSLLHKAASAVSDFFGKEKLYNNQKAKVGQQLWIADEIVMRLRKQNRPVEAAKVLAAAAALHRSADPVRIDSTNSIIKARVSEFNKLYAGNGVGLGESVSFALAAKLISILTGIMASIIPGGFAISDYIKRTSEHIVNLGGLMTGMLSRAEYGEIEARSRERFTFATMFKGVAGVLLIGAAVYIYWKWKKR